MKIQFLTRINLLLYGVCLAVMVLTAPVKAGVIEPKLQEAMTAGSDVRIIVQFKNTLDLDAHPGKGKGKGLELASLLWALRDQADSSQAAAVDLLHARGAKRFRFHFHCVYAAVAADESVLHFHRADPVVRNRALELARSPD